MEFPEEIVRIIKEFSLPLTRLDWRICGKITRDIYREEYKRIVTHRHLKLLSCNNDEYVEIYNNYKRIFTLRKYEATFRNL